MNNNFEYTTARNLAADALIKWVKEAEGYLEMRQKVNDCLQTSGANDQQTEERIIAHRKIAANHILIYAIHGLSSVQIQYADTLLKRIAEQDAPTVSNGIRR